MAGGARVQGLHHSAEMVLPVGLAPPIQMSTLMARFLPCRWLPVPENPTTTPQP